MKRIITGLITTAIAVGILVMTVPAARVIVVGHTQDLISRTTTSQYVMGRVSATGSFDETSIGRDAAHWANGSVSIINTADGKRYIQLGMDFNSGPLPDGYVYYSKDKDINSTSAFDETAQIEAGKLIKGSGASFYEVPMDADIGSITILCKQFHVFISSADVYPEFSLEAKQTAYNALQQHIRRNN